MLGRREPDFQRNRAVRRLPRTIENTKVCQQLPLQGRLMRNLGHEVAVIPRKERPAAHTRSDGRCMSTYDVRVFQKCHDSAV